MENAQSTAHTDAQVGALLERAEADLAELDRLSTHDQVAGYGRIHDALVQALARTADSTGPTDGRPMPGRPMPGRPVPGRPGA
ncbi:hypothetical protein [Nakamurella sp.]|uniref:hypothetical protein n=1 Tax=Nakamurella sp. TaxID=1869182 RepID=UPI003784D859